MKKFSSPSAPIAKFRLGAIFTREEIFKELEAKTKKVAEEKAKVLAASEIAEQLVSDVEIFNLVAEDVQKLFALAGVEVGEEQLIRIISELRDFFLHCETQEEKIQRIQDLSQFTYFNE